MTPAVSARSIGASPAHSVRSRARCRSHQTIQCRAATSAPPPPSSSGSSSGRRTLNGAAASTDPARRLQQLQQLVREATELALATGPRGVTRTAQAASAVLALAQEQLGALQRGGPPDAPPVVLRKLFERLGATYIKLGQFVASSPTLFPEEYVTEFQKCLDQAPAVPFEVIRRTVESELRMSIEDVFASVDPVPLASASIAQVHAAVLRGSNKEVVLKVLKPGVEDTLLTDLNFLLLSAKVLEFLNPELSRTSLAPIVSDIRTSMLQEVDFTQEAQHLLQFDGYLDRSGLRGVATCPGVYRQYSTRQLLVMDRLRGVPLTDLSQVKAWSRLPPEQVMINALNVWFGSLLGCETFHADLHAGNLLVLPDGRVGFIDFGIVGRISPATWRAVEALLTATATDDTMTMARALVTIGATSGEVNMAAFAADLEGLLQSFRELDPQVVVQAGAGGAVATSVTADDAAVNRLLLELVRVGEANGIRFPREFGILLKQILYLDRFTKALAPGLQVFNDSRIQLEPSFDLD